MWSLQDTDIGDKITVRKCPEMPSGHTVLTEAWRSVTETTFALQPFYFLLSGSSSSMPAESSSGSVCS